MFVDYSCNDCGRVFEVRISSKPPSHVECKYCGGYARRVYSSLNFNMQHWQGIKKREIADALGEDIDPESLPSKPFREI